MPLHVLKFGGTSVANTDRIRHVATIIQQYIENGDQVIVVVSAMAGTTNQLLSYTKQMSKNPSAAECDVIAASGEQITAGLVAIALQEINLPSQSFLGSQIPIYTNNNHTDAYIHSIHGDFLRHQLSAGVIPVIAGFQGVCINDASNEQKMNDVRFSAFRITALGRGGSDTTAVAIAAALNADACYIYTDVEGVFSADPRIVPNAQKLQDISYTAMLELAAKGAKVLHNRSVELAMRYGVKLCILSSFTSEDGTYIMSDDQIGYSKDMEEPKFISIAHTLNHAKISIQTTSDEEHRVLFNKIVDSFARQKINIHNIQCHAPHHMSFLISKNDMPSIQATLHTIFTSINNQAPHTSNHATWHCDANIVTFTIVGIAMNRDAQLYARIFQFLTDHDISVLMMSITETTITLTIHHHHMPNALVLLHDELLNFKHNEKKNDR